MTQQIYQLIKQINLEDTIYSININNQDNNYLRSINLEDYICVVPSVQEIVNYVITNMVLELYHTTKSFPKSTQISYRLECDDDKESPIVWNAGMPPHCHLCLPTILYLRMRQTV
jgi:hypothetical protein